MLLLWALLNLQYMSIGPIPDNWEGRLTRLRSVEPSGATWEPEPTQAFSFCLMCNHVYIYIYATYLYIQTPCHWSSNHSRCSQRKPRLAVTAHGMT